MLMPELATRVQPTIDIQPTPYPASRHGLGVEPEDVRGVEVPPAFYCNADIPPPPPGDAHWREWYQNNGPEPVPHLLLVGVPICMGVFGVLHIMLILVVLRMSGLY
jgi:hypothetical protein